jgi:hypothetical protein
MKDNQHEQLFTELTAEFEAPAFKELDDEVAASCSGGLFYVNGPDPDVILYDKPNFQGNSLRINATDGDGDDNLSNYGWNDKTSSIRVVRGKWRIFQNAGFVGKKGEVTFLNPGKYPATYADNTKFLLPDNSLTGIRRDG